MSQKYCFDADHDGFWDLSDLVPKRKAVPRTGNFAHNTDTVEVTLRSASRTEGGVDVPLSERPVFPYRQDAEASKPCPECSYKVEGSLLREVRIYPWKNEYTYYEQFREQAELLATREGKECPAVDFFSYMPRYTQLNAAQLRYYLWWRTEFRRGVCLPADYSYLLLYLFELINLDEAHQDPLTGQKSMYRLWLSYRDRYPRLDELIREWLCDYSLLYHLPPPKLDPAQYRLLLSGCRLKEFYVSAKKNEEAMRHAIMLFCNNYDYTKSKFYRPDTAADYDRVLGGAIDVTLEHLRGQNGAALTDTGGISTVTRDIFSSAVCSQRVKRRIEVDFTSFSHTHELRYIMTDVLKYAENALRGVLGIKSRLSYYAIDVPLRAKLDEYLAVALPVRKARVNASKTAKVPDYEKRYDLPVMQISPERAAEIEAESWQTTKRLVEAFDGEQMSVTGETCEENAAFMQEEAVPEHFAFTCPTAAETAVIEHRTAEEKPFAEALGDLAGFLPLALVRDRSAQRAFAASRGMMVDAVADKINTVAGDILGDIVLEENGGVFAVIEDYLDYLQEQGVLEDAK